MSHRVAKQLRPVYEETRRVVRAGRYVHADKCQKVTSVIIRILLAREERQCLFIVKEHHPELTQLLAAHS